MAAIHTSNPSPVTVNPFDPMNPLEYWKALVDRSEEELKSLERLYSTTLAKSYEYWRIKYYLSEDTLSLLHEYIRGQAQELRPVYTAFQRLLTELLNGASLLPKTCLKTRCTNEQNTLSTR